MSTRPSAEHMTDSGALSRRAWGVLLVLCGALFLDALDVSMIGVALPSIRTDLGMSTNSLQWVVSTYVLGYGGFLLLGAAPPTSSVAAGCSCSRWRSFSSPRAWVGWRRTPRS